MQRIFLFIAMMAVALSCGIVEIGGVDSQVNSSGPVWGGMNGSHSGASSNSKVYYMTAMDYKKGYDWRADEARETVKCSLVVYEDGLPVMKIPVGEAYEISPDPDKHRIIGGHLYTDYSTTEETVVKCDGRELFRYEGAEYICGMELVGEDLYSLGQSRDGSGFALRRNGEVIISKDKASLVGGLNNEEGDLCFAFCEQVLSSGKSSYRYYASINGSVSQVAVREDIKTVWDVLVCRDQVIYVATLVGIDAPVLVMGDSMTQLSFPIGATLLSCNIFKTASAVGVEGIYRLRSGAYISTIWLDKTELCSYIGKGAISAINTDGDGVSFVMNPFGRNACGTIYRSGELFEMPEGYTVISDGCVRTIDGILYVGMSSQDGCRPIVWKDGVVDSLEVNGYITAIYQVDASRATSPTRAYGTDRD